MQEIKQKMSSRITKARSYIDANAPQLVTAAAAVGTACATIGTFVLVRRYHNEMVNDAQSSRRAIDYALANNLDYEFFPGLGVMYPHGHQSRPPIN